jgi:hypothetical protein
MQAVKTQGWFRRHRVVTRLLWTVLALAILEAILLYYYLNHWVTLPAL